MLVRTGSMEDDGSWQVDHFEATSDDEGGILILPVSDNSVSGASNPQAVVPILYFPNQDSQRVNEAESEGEEEGAEDEAPSVPNEAGISDVQDDCVTSPDMFGLASNPRRLIILIVSLALFSTVLVVKSFYDHVRYRELVQAAKEKEILMEQIRRLKDENEKLHHQESCWENPTSCGRSLFAKNWESLSENTITLLGSVKLPGADRFLQREHSGVPFHELHSVINSAVDTTLDRVGKWKDTAMRKAVANQEKLSKKFSSVAGFASERFGKIKDGAASNPMASRLSMPSLSNSTSLQTLLNSSFFQTAAVGAVTSLLVGALFELEPFVGVE